MANLTIQIIGDVYFDDAGLPWKVTEVQPNRPFNPWVTVVYCGNPALFRPTTRMGCLYTLFPYLKDIHNNAN